MNDSERSTLFDSKCRMFKNVKNHFKKQFNDNTCTLNCGLTHTDSQSNMLICKVLTDKVQTNIKYSDLFSDTFSQSGAIKTYMKLIKLRNEILKKTKKMPCLN